MWSFAPSTRASLFTAAWLARPVPPYLLHAQYSTWTCTCKAVTCDVRPGARLLGVSRHLVGTWGNKAAEKDGVEFFGSSAVCTRMLIQLYLSASLDFRVSVC